MARFFQLPAFLACIGVAWAFAAQPETEICDFDPDVGESYVQVDTVTYSKQMPEQPKFVEPEPKAAVARAAREGMPGPVPKTTNTVDSMTYTNPMPDFPKYVEPEPKAAAARARVAGDRMPEPVPKTTDTDSKRISSCGGVNQCCGPHGAEELGTQFARVSASDDTCIALMNGHCRTETYTTRHMSTKFAWKSADDPTCIALKSGQCRMGIHTATPMSAVDEITWKAKEDPSCTVLEKGKCRDKNTNLAKTGAVTSATDTTCAKSFATGVCAHGLGIVVLLFSLTWHP